MYFPSINKHGLKVEVCNILSCILNWKISTKYCTVSGDYKTLHSVVSLSWHSQAAPGEAGERRRKRPSDKGKSQGPISSFSLLPNSVTPSWTTHEEVALALCHHHIRTLHCCQLCCIWSMSRRRGLVFWME